MERTTLSAVFVLGVRLALFRDCAARPRASGSRSWRTSGGRKSPRRGDTAARLPEGPRSGIAGVMARTATRFRFKGGENLPARPKGSGGRRGRTPTSLVFRGASPHELETFPRSRGSCRRRGFARDRRGRNGGRGRGP